MKTLFPKQQTSKEVLLKALQNYGAALDSSHTGTGKTCKSIEIARDLGRPVLVICPKIVISSWREAFEEQGLPVPPVINYEKIRAGGTPFASKKFKKVFSWNLEPKTLVILDEVHKCKGETSVNGALLKTLVDQGHLCLMLSATAAKNPGDLNAIGYALKLHNGNGFRSWALKNGCGIDNYRKLYFPIKSRPLLEKLHDQIYPDRGHRITREDLSEFFSETSILSDPLDLGNEDEIATLYAEMEAELALIEESSSADKGANALTARLRARQAVEALKVPAFVQMIEDYREQVFSVACFFNFKSTIEAVASRLSEPCGRIEGVSSEVERKERQQSIDDFQSNKVRVILANLQAGGTGLNLHDTVGDSPRVSLISPCDSAEEIVQVLGRIDRAGAKSDTLQRVVFAAGTIEVEVAKNFRKKLVDMGILHGHDKK